MESTMRYELWRGDRLVGTTHLDWEREEPLICMGYLTGEPGSVESLAELTDGIPRAGRPVLELRRADGTVVTTRRIRLFDVAEILGGARLAGIDEARPFDLADDERYHIMVELSDAREIP